MKKGQGISLNVIIIAAIALLVLVILSVIFMGRFGAFTLPYDEEKHVCEEWKLNDVSIKMSWEESFKFDCFDFETKKKTQIDNDYVVTCQECNDWRAKTKCELNPEDEDCVCDEYVDDKSKPTSGFPCPGSCEEKEVQKCNVFGVSQGLEINFTVLIEYGKCSVGFDKIFPKGEATAPIDGDWIHFQIINVTINNCEQCWEYKQVCISAHEKPKPIKIDLETEKCLLHTNLTVYNDFEKMYIHCDNLLQWCIEEPGEYCNWYDNGCCLEKEELNECEKGNPDWIREIYYCNKTDEHICIEEVIVVDGGGAVRCRPKELRDFSCQELKKPFYFDFLTTDIHKGELKDGWMFGKYGTIALYDIMIERGCDI